MSLFSLRTPKERIGAILDIGSGSVLVAIVVSKESESEPSIIWSHREHAPLRNIESIDQSAKAVLTALVNALLKFDSEGRQALHAATKKSQVDVVQCCIAAPWSYTVTKNINYVQEESFTITEALVEELIDTAERKIATELDSTDSATELGLTIVARTTMDLLANGYRIKDPYNQEASSLTLAHASVVTQKYLVDELSDLKEKIFPSAELHELSHMLAFYGVSELLSPNAFDTCLVDITSEATEIGIVRDGSLSYATHTPFGIFSLAREIATITSLPLFEAFKHLQSPEYEHFLATLPTEQQKDIEKVFDSYIARLAELFHETGDDLSIPKQILLHGDLASEALLRKCVEQAAIRVLKSEPNVIMTTPAILKSTFPHYLPSATNSAGLDTGMLLSALFFHKQNTRASFEYF